MLFPLMIGVAAGIAIQRCFLDDEEDKCCKQKEKERVSCDAVDADKEGDVKSSIMDFINKAKQNHPEVVPRRNTAVKLLQILAGKEKEITFENFDRAKAVVEEYCGIRKLLFDEENKTVCGGEINEECPETPVLDVHKLECLTKEELILIAPKLKDLFADVG